MGSAKIKEPAYKHARRGRPQKLNDEIQKTICQAIEVGNFLQTATAFAGIRKETHHNWLRKGRRYLNGEITGADAKRCAEFLIAIEKAEAASEVRKLNNLYRTSEEGNVTAITWFLSRRFPERWGAQREGAEPPQLGASGEPKRFNDTRPPPESTEEPDST